GVRGADRDDPEARVNLGLVSLDRRRPREAIAHLARALELRPDDAPAEGYLGQAYALAGDGEAGGRHLRRSLELAPDHPRGRGALAGLAAGQGRLREAVELYRGALRRDPDLVAASSGLAWILATAADETLRDGREAVRCAERSAALSGGGRADVLDHLAAAYAEAGRFEEAVATASSAAGLAAAMGSEELSAAIGERLGGGRGGRRLRAPPGPEGAGGGRGSRAMSLPRCGNGDRAVPPPPPTFSWRRRWRCNSSAGGAFPFGGREHAPDSAKGTRRDHRLLRPGSPLSVANVSADPAVRK